MANTFNLMHQDEPLQSSRAMINKLNANFVPLKNFDLPMLWDLSNLAYQLQNLKPGKGGKTQHELFYSFEFHLKLLISTDFWNLNSKKIFVKSNQLKLSRASLSRKLWKCKVFAKDSKLKNCVRTFFCFLLTRFLEKPIIWWKIGKMGSLFSHCSNLKTKTLTKSYENCEKNIRKLCFSCFSVNLLKFSKISSKIAHFLLPSSPN